MLEFRHNVHMEDRIQVAPRAPGKPPQPTSPPTVALLFGLTLTAVALGGDTPSTVARIGAIGVGLSLAASLTLEAGASRANLLRTDVAMLLALYGLVFFEFLFPQPAFEQQPGNADDTYFAVQACLLAFGGIAAGRHLLGARQRPWHIVSDQMPPKALLILFWGSFALAYLHMLLAVDFNPVELVKNFMGPRFSQPWQRGRYGDWKALLTEIGAVIYLIPPIAGVVLGRGRVYSGGNRFLACLALIFTMFYAFSNGTRNIFAVFGVTFAVGYFFGQGRRLTNRVMAVMLISALFIAANAYYALQFRRIGLAAYLVNDQEQTDDGHIVFVDNSLFVIGQLTRMFPAEHDFIGMAAPLWLVARPVPRALWPGKPDGSEVEATLYLNEGPSTTLASTFVGESFMAAGVIGVAITALSLGALSRWWTSRAYTTDSDLGVLIYSSGFFAMVMTMRSVYQLPVAILPTLAVITFGLLSQRTARRRQVKIGVIKKVTVGTSRRPSSGLTQ